MFKLYVCLLLAGSMSSSSHYHKPINNTGCDWCLVTKRNIKTEDFRAHIQTRPVDNRVWIVMLDRR